MANNNTNIISIVINLAPAPPPPTSAPQPSSSRSNSGTSRSTSEQLVASPGFWALLCLAAGLVAGAGYLVWRKVTSKQGDPENTPAEGVSVGVQTEEIPEGDYVQARPPYVITTPSATPSVTPSTTPKKKEKKLDSAKASSLSSTTRNVLHVAKEGLTMEPAVF
ncbi:hypothetical protein N7516_005597 [Penicillium verrucosum]|uniref:uncharacterized protein n=1 Tax=Penicillium verrucosum TaxID=60171 RepID=UPI002544EA20|nr:uncharacterized protein N7516_005597 [Penicillium verrucosum]KAJ5945429.1 hypothetical protein N7516_005597 [Penicillium verrucosum]